MTTQTSGCSDTARQDGAPVTLEGLTVEQALAYQNLFGLSKKSGQSLYQFTLHQYTELLEARGWNPKDFQKDFPVLAELGRKFLNADKQSKALLDNTADQAETVNAIIKAVTRFFELQRQIVELRHKSTSIRFENLQDKGGLEAHLNKAKNFTELMNYAASHIKNPTDRLMEAAKYFRLVILQFEEFDRRCPIY